MIPSFAIEPLPLSREPNDQIFVEILYLQFVFRWVKNEMRTFLQRTSSTHFDGKKFGSIDGISLNQPPHNW